MLNDIKSRVSNRFEVSIILEDYFKNNAEEVLDWVMGEDFGGVEIVRKTQQRTFLVNKRLFLLLLDFYEKNTSDNIELSSVSAKSRKFTNPMDNELFWQSVENDNILGG